MEWKITYATNFLRVFRLPEELPEDYCFGGNEQPVTLMMVDWFNAVSQMDFQKVETVKIFDVASKEYQLHVKALKAFIKGKSYFNPAHTYMILTDYGDVFMVNPEKRANELQEEFEKVLQKAKEKTN